MDHKNMLNKQLGSEFEKPAPEGNLVYLTDAQLEVLVKLVGDLAWLEQETANVYRNIHGMGKEAQARATLYQGILERLTERKA